MGDRTVIQRGRFWKQGARAQAGESVPQQTGGGFRPSANLSTGMDLEKLKVVYYDRNTVSGTMDWMEAESPAGVPVPQKTNRLGGGIINARLDNLALSVSPAFVGYVGTTTGTSATATTPKVTYSNVANMSKSYSPASLAALAEGKGKR